jgi:hypothetical protein
MQTRSSPSYGAFALSARLRGEREGTRRAGDGEGEVGDSAARNSRLPTSPQPSPPPRGGEGDFWL